jgi:hypothetical protein
MMGMDNPLKPNLIRTLFKNSICASKKTQNLLMLFRAIISVYSENHPKPIYTKYRVYDYYGSWYIQLPLGLKGIELHAT